MPHYMLDLLLRKHRVESSAASVVFASQAQLVDDLLKGRLDGAALLGKYIAQARRDLGTNAIVFADKALFEIKTFVVVRDTLARQRPQAIDKFLRGCLQAERYVAEQPERSMAIVARRLKMEIADIRQAWPDCHFAVEFHQAVLNDLEGKARWRMERHLTPAKRIPNFLGLLYYEGLERVAPERVTLIH